jgi:hypothetical protein
LGVGVGIGASIGGLLAALPFNLTMASMQNFISLFLGEAAINYITNTHKKVSSCVE